jgi:hypothetical protein
MYKYLMCIIIVLTINSLSYSQSLTQGGFVNSFPSPTDHVISFARQINKGKRMTRAEALKFVCYGDTTLLTCKQKIVNMEDESKWRISRDSYLPEKCFKIISGNITVIGITSYRCQDPSKSLERILTVYIVDQSNVKTDSVTAFTGDDYDNTVSGALNSHNLRLFLIGKFADADTKQAKLFSVNSKSLKFRKERTQTSLKISSDNALKDIEALGWTEDFDSK